ncbi:hypothetical protein BASA81_001234 [Batrachochytrium salamandrivorans]|nr:hypothetical protein BASA81_001234 [Batrachochytrium salamandrivorans]
MKRFSSAVICPGCDASLPSLDKLDFHLSFACLSRHSKKEKLAEEKTVTEEVVGPVVKSRLPPGLVVIENFITPQEEALLLASLRAGRWKPTTRNGKAACKHWGTVLDYLNGKPHVRHPKPELGEEPVPEFLRIIIDRFKQHDSTSVSWNPNNCNAQHYVKSRGDHLTAHYDDRKLSGDIVCNISLLSDCVMTFRKADTSFRVALPRLSASVMTRSSRYDYTHEIAHQDLLGEQRISLNFRQQIA